MDTKKTNSRRAALAGAMLLGLALTVLLTAMAARYRWTSDRVRADTLRLHILANSDRTDDQLAKLAVRDAVLELIGPALADVTDRDEAAARLCGLLPVLQRLAVQTAGQPAAVTLREEDFPSRRYDGFALPGGRYLALRIELGAAQGHNWFCVLYPALCVSGTVCEYPTRAENELVFGDYRIRFALWDLLTQRKR